MVYFCILLYIMVYYAYVWEGFCGGLIAAMDGLRFTRFSSRCFLLKNVLASKHTLLISGSPQSDVGLEIVVRVDAATRLPKVRPPGHQQLCGSLMAVYPKSQFEP